MELWSALLLGLAGSPHCAGMCGPLAMTLPGGGGSRAHYLAGRLAYNLGRVATYAALGILFGLAGHGFRLAGLQQALSLGAGILLLATLWFPRRLSLARPVAALVARLKTGLGGLLRRRSLASLAGVGLLNGLLPCGPVYVACAAAAATGGILHGAATMLAFGAGTLPVMLGMSLLGGKAQAMARMRLQRLVPATIAVVGVLLVLRGLGLGIPYLSPALAAGAACH